MDGENSREWARHSIAVLAVCRTTSTRQKAVISDLSPDGCCVVRSSLLLRVGQIITIQIGDMASFAGEVRWCDKGRAGVQFTQTIYQPIVDHIAQLHPRAPDEPVSDLRL